MATTVKEMRDMMDVVATSELEKIKSELEPHFKNYGKLTVVNKIIELRTPNGEGWVVIRLHDCYIYSNDFYKMYEKLQLDPKKIFSEVSYSLKEIIVKPKIQ